MWGAFIPRFTVRVPCEGMVSSRVLAAVCGTPWAQFKAIQKAFETLKDDEKRQMYDQYGEEGLEQGGGGGGGGGGVDLFDILSGRAGGNRQPQGKRKGEDVVFPLKVTLEELYNGITKKLRLTKNVICSGCNGYACDTFIS